MAITQHYHTGTRLLAAYVKFKCCFIHVQSILYIVLWVVLVCSGCDREVMPGVTDWPELKSVPRAGFSADDAVSCEMFSVQRLIDELPPSSELIDFYRDKTHQLMLRNDELTTKLDKIISAVESGQQLRQQLSERDREVAGLRSTLDDLQLHVLAERQRRHQLTHDHRRIQRESAELKQRMRVLQSLTGCSDQTVTFYIDKLSANGATFPLRPIQQLEEADCENNKVKEAETCDRLRDELDSARGQLEEAKRLMEDERQCWLEQRRIAAEERDSDRNSLQQQRSYLSDQLGQCQRLLRDSAADYLALHARMRREEAAWMAEKDRWLLERELLTSPAGAVAAGDKLAGIEQLLGDGRFSVQTAYQRLQSRAASLMNKLDEAKAQAESLKKQNTSLTEKLKKSEEARKASVTVFKNRVSRMREAATILRRRYDQLDTRRRLEASGFCSAVSQTRRQMARLERRISRLLASGVAVSNIKHVQQKMDRLSVGEQDNDEQESSQEDDWSTSDTAVIQNVTICRQLSEGVLQARHAVRHLEQELINAGHQL